MPIYVIQRKTKYKIVEGVTVFQGGQTPTTPPVIPDPTPPLEDPDLTPDPAVPVDPPVVPTPVPEPTPVPDPTPPGGGGPAPAPSPPPVDPPEIVPSFSHTNLSGDYQDFSYPSNYVSIREWSSEDYYIRYPNSAIPDFRVGNRSSGGNAIDNFMWDYKGDVFVWLENNMLQRRRPMDGSVIEEVQLPATVDGRLVQWRAGHRNSINDQSGLWIWAYDQPADTDFVLPIGTDPLAFDLADGFWVDTITQFPADERKFHNLYQKEQGFAIEPSSTTPQPPVATRQSLQFHFMPDRDSEMDLIETLVTANDWSHTTWQGSSVAFWSNVNARIEIHDASGMIDNPKDLSITSSGTMTHSINVQRMAAVYNLLPTDYVSYLHGHMTENRLVFSVHNQTSGKFGIMVYHLNIDELVAIHVEFDAALAFDDSPRPSISRDGKRVVYLTNSGLIIRDIAVPVTSLPKPPAPTPTNPFPPVNRPAFFSWNSSVIKPADWNNWINSSAVSNDDDTGRPMAQGNTTVYPGQIDAGQITLIGSDEVPTMDSSGRFYHNVSADSFNLHNMIRMRSGILQHLTWFLPRRLYRMDMEFEIEDDDGVGWTTAPNCVDWAIVFQIWGPFPRRWSGFANPPPSRVSPPLGLRLGCLSSGSLQWELSTLGTDNPDRNAPWQHNDTVIVPAVTGRQRISIWWKKDHTGADSYARFDINGVTEKEVTNVKLGTPFQADGAPASNVTESSGGQNHFGVYTPRSFASPGVEIRFTEMTAYLLN